MKYRDYEYTAFADGIDHTLNRISSLQARGWDNLAELVEINDELQEVMGVLDVYLGGN